MDHSDQYKLMKQIAADLGLYIEIWSASDIQNVRPDLTPEQARQVLDAVERHHDANIGVTWYVLQIHADELFPHTSDA